MTDEEKETQELSGDGLGDGPAQPEAADAPTAADERLKAEITELNLRLFRAHADFENYRKRVAREKEELTVYANQKLLLQLLPVLDNLDRALGTPKAEGDDRLRQGVELTARTFREILAREGVTPIEAAGQPFDPNLHEAVMTVESADHEDGTIVSEFQKGYKLGERVIRPSMVQVSKKS